MAKKKHLTIVLTDDITLLQRRRAYIFKGLTELSDFIIKRVKGEVSDIMLPDQCRVDGLIADFAEQVVQRTKEFDDANATELRAAATRNIHSA